MKGENVNTKFPRLWKRARCERRVNLRLGNLVLREKTEALLLWPALHKSLLYVDKVSTPFSLFLFLSLALCCCSSWPLPDPPPCLPGRPGALRTRAAHF